MKTLLIVADPRKWRLLSEVLAQFGHEVAVVEDADGACAVCRAEAFPLVIFDADLPGADGAQICHRLRALPQCAESMILAAGRHPEREHLDALLAAGADDYLTDPDDTERLQVRLAVAQRRLGAPTESRHSQGADESLQRAKEELQAIYDGMVDGLLIVDVETKRFVRANPAVCRMFGYSEEELLSMSIMDLHPAEEFPTIMEELARMTDGWSDLGKDMACVRKDGSMFCANIAASRIMYDGRPCAVGLFRDVSEQRKAEEAKRRSEENLRSLLRSMDDLVFDIDVQGKFRHYYQSSYAGDLYVPPSKFLGKHFREVLPADIAGQLQAAIDAVETSRGAPQLDYQMEIQGRKKWFNARISPIRDGSGACTGYTAVVRDVTDRKEAVDQLRESERRYRLIADNVVDMIWRARFEGANDLLDGTDDRDPLRTADELLRRWKFDYVSPSVGRLLGHRAEEVAAMELKDFLTADAYETVRDALAEELLIEQQHSKDLRRQRTLTLKRRAKDGSTRWGEVTARFLRDDENRIVGVLGVTRDVTQRKLAEETLRKSEAKLRGLFENLPDLVVMVDHNLTMQFVNRVERELAPEMVIGVRAPSFVAPEHQKRYCEAFQRVFATRRTQAVEVLDTFGSWWACRLVPMVEDGDVQNAMIIATDITEQKEAARAVQKERRLLRQLLDLHERDRRLIAYEIHDGFAQQLTGVLYRLQGFRELQARQPQEAWGTFDAGLRLLSQSIEEARRLISGLRPPILDEQGILAAIEYLVAESTKHEGPEIEFLHNVEFDRLPAPLESAVFRIAQESLANACRHSQSEKIRVELVQREDRIHIDVRDWGTGFDPAESEEGRFGLQGIRERVRLLGGEIAVETGPGEGTRIAVELPLVESAGREQENSPPRRREHGEEKDY